MNDIEPGTILDYQWGYEQTNHDFFEVTKRSGEWITIVPMTAVEVSDGPLTMTGRVTPIAIDATAKPLRRKIARWADGRIIGAKIASYAACAEVWNGEPKRVSHYA